MPSRVTAPTEGSERDPAKNIDGSGGTERRVGMHVISIIAQTCRSLPPSTALSLYRFIDLSHRDAKIQLSARTTFDSSGVRRYP